MPQTVASDGEVMGETPIEVECIPQGLVVFSPQTLSPQTYSNCQMGKPRVGAVRELPLQGFVVYANENRCNGISQTIETPFACGTDR